METTSPLRNDPTRNCKENSCLLFLLLFFPETTEIHSPARHVTSGALKGEGFHFVLEDFTSHLNPLGSPP